MEQWWSMLDSLMTGDRTLMALRALFIFLLGFVIAYLVRSMVSRLLGRRLNVQQRVLIGRAVYYLLLILFTISALNELGFKLSVLLGAAGVLSVAIGFASQTPASNLVSGLFLIAERSFSIGDIIKVGNTCGEVLSIDLLSIKLRTPDNLYVRIPNQNVIQSEVYTLSRFRIRRVDLDLQIAYQTDLAKVREILSGLASSNPLCLEDPKPTFTYMGLGDNISIQFCVWAAQDRFLEVKNSILEEIKYAFTEAGIVIH